MGPAGRASFTALGTTAVVTALDDSGLGAAVAATEQVVADIDAACSRFRSDSELERLNAAGGATVGVSPLFAEALRLALEAAAVTDGDLDPTIGEAVRVLGYDRDFSGLAADGSPVMAVRVATGWRAVELDTVNRAVRLPAGVRLDLGATAKAFAADLAAAAAAAAAGCGVCVGLGGDLAIAGDPPDDGWLIGVAESHAAGDDELAARVALMSGGIATSSTTVRRWARGGSTHHHIVDPRTGASANEVWRTVTVAASTCLGANVATTTAIVRGERGVAWLESLGLPARLVAADGSIRYLGAWPGAEAEVVR